MNWLTKKWDNILSYGMVALALVVGIYAGLRSGSFWAGIGIAIGVYIALMATWVVIVVFHYFSERNKKLKCCPKHTRLEGTYADS